MFLLALVGVAGSDPAGSWLSYARFDAPGTGVITALNTSWKVPSKPAIPFGSNAPGWWFGVMDKDGDGALVQPILAYGYLGSRYTIFNGVFDWTDGSWHTSDEKYTVEPNDTIVSSVTYNKAANSYTMRIASTRLGKAISTEYALEREQHEVESSAVFVLEHQPTLCKAYPRSGQMAFEHIYVEVDGKPVARPKWQALQERPACNSEAVVVDPATIQFTWDPSATHVPTGEDRNPAQPPAKWASAAPPEWDAAAKPTNSTPCCRTCEPGKQKFYSIPHPDAPGAECGECCLNPKLYNFWKLFEPKLLPGACAALGYTVYNSTETDGVPPLAVTNDRYTKPGNGSRVLP